MRGPTENVSKAIKDSESYLEPIAVASQTSPWNQHRILSLVRIRTCRSSARHTAVEKEYRVLG